MALGIGEMTALAAGYFLLEFIMQYPPGAVVNLFDQELLSIVFVAIFLRSAFHVVSGIAVARLAPWSGVWFWCGWPIMLVITFGIFHALAQQFVVDGYLENAWEAIAIVKLLLYLMLVVVDLFFIIPMINDFYKTPSAVKDSASLLTPVRIVSIAFLSIASVSILLFTGQSLRQGFHKGYYKLKGEKPSAVRQVRVSTTKKSILTTTEKPSPSPEVEKQEAVQVPAKAPEENIQSVSITSQEKQPYAPSAIEDAAMQNTAAKQDKVKEGLPYQKLFGFVGGFLLCAGFFLQVIEFMSTRKSVLSYMLFCLAFISWMIYSIHLQLWPIILGSSVALAACLWLVVINWSNEN